MVSDVSGMAAFASEMACDTVPIQWDATSAYWPRRRVAPAV
ncbi:hypothetical protein [Streptomyces sp. NPDC047028]